MSLNIVQWNKDLETGIELIDEQHKKFLIYANKFIIKVRAQKEEEASKEELQFLQDYLLYHFQAEETFQVESGYDAYLEHQAEHKYWAFKVKEMTTVLEENAFSCEAVDEFCKFINSWIVKHILDFDIKFCRYYNQWNKDINKR